VHSTVHPARRTGFRTCDEAETDSGRPPCQAAFPAVARCPGWLRPPRAGRKLRDLCAPGDYTDWALSRLDRAQCLAWTDPDTGLGYAAETIAALTGPQRQGIIADRARGLLGALSPAQLVSPWNKHGRRPNHPAAAARPRNEPARQDFSTGACRGLFSAALAGAVGIPGNASPRSARSRSPCGPPWSSWPRRRIPLRARTARRRTSPRPARPV